MRGQRCHCLRGEDGNRCQESPRRTTSFVTICVADAEVRHGFANGSGPDPSGRSGTGRTMGRVCPVQSAWSGAGRHGPDGSDRSLKVTARPFDVECHRSEGGPRQARGLLDSSCGVASLRGEPHRASARPCRVWSDQASGRQGDHSSCVRANAARTADAVVTPDPSVGEGRRAEVTTHLMIAEPNLLPSGSGGIAGRW